MNFSEKKRINDVNLYRKILQRSKVITNFIVEHYVYFFLEGAIICSI